MNEENTQKLIEACPILYRHFNFFQCGDGWFDLIYKGSVKIESLIQSNNTPEQIQQALTSDRDKDEFDVPYVVQVKEKFGTLRFYCWCFQSHAIDAVISRMEEDSESICEDCGKPGELRMDIGWYSTLCDTHHQESRDRVYALEKKG